MSMSTENANELTDNLLKPNSKFYLTEAVDVDGQNDGSERTRGSLTPEVTIYKVPLRPNSPPPPAPNHMGLSFMKISLGIGARISNTHFLSRLGIDTISPFIRHSVHMPSIHLTSDILFWVAVCSSLSWN